MLRVFMCKRFLLLYLLLPGIVSAQLYDDFADGDFTQNPTWVGDEAYFVVENQQLRSNGPAAASTLYLTTGNSLAQQCVWEFLVDLRFNPTLNNYVRIYLLSSEENLRNPLNGYYIHLGQTNEDYIKLFRQDGTQHIELFSGKTPFAGNIRVRIKVIRRATGEWFIFAAPGNTTNFLPEFGQSNPPPTDTQHAQTTHFGVLCSYTTTARATQYYFDDFSVLPDNNPPAIQAVEVIDAHTLRILFDEPLEHNTAQQAGNYFIDGGMGNPSSVVLQPNDERQVELVFVNSFLDAQIYTLSLTGLSDWLGNTIPADNPANYTFEYIELSPAAPEDLIINEIMADPTPIVGLPDAEYIEIYNRSNKNINLQGFTLNNRLITAQSHILRRGAYVLLTPQSSAHDFNLSNVIGMSSFDPLTNTGKTVVLRSASGQIIDEVTYSDTWYQDNSKRNGGWSLERINPYLPCGNQGHNWRASISAVGGTPGSINSIFDDSPDITPPRLVDIKPVGYEALQLTFSEPMEATALAFSAHYTLDGAVGVLQAQPNGNTEVLLLLDTALQPGRVYQITLSSALKDCSGNSLQPNSYETGIGRMPQWHELLITEIMANPRPAVQLPEREYLELYNPTSSIISLSGCQLSDANNSNTLPPVSLLPGERIILCSSSAVGELQAYGRAVSVPSFISLTIRGKPLIITNPQGATVFALHYSDEWYQDANKRNGGWSLEMIDERYPCGGALNWRASEDARGGTPGQPNSVSEARPDHTPPAIRRVYALQANRIELYFSEVMDSISTTHASVQLQPSGLVERIRIHPPFFRQATLELSEPLLAGIRYNLQLSGASDCAGNLLVPAIHSFGLVEAADSADIIVNEILFNPRVGGSRFVELYNRSQKYINLQNWQLARWHQGSISNQTTITQDVYVLEPGAYLCITNNIENIQQNYPLAVDKPFIQTSTLPAYPFSEGTVLLLNAQGKIWERFDYSEDYHFALLRDKKGVSLERIRADKPTQDAANWFSAASSVGYATPGWKNSQSLEHVVVQGGISLSSPVFTPDEDGIQDFLEIRYAFQQHGFVGSVLIFDMQGRLVRRLASNQLLAAQGSFLWHGEDDQRRPVRSGYYIVMFEVFNLQGQQMRYKEAVVVSRR